MHFNTQNSDVHRGAFARILRALAVVSFRYNVICNLQIHEQERVYNDIARKVSDGTYSRPQEVIAALIDVYPHDDQFKAAFSRKEFRTTNSRDKKVVRYILFEQDTGPCIQAIQGVLSAGLQSFPSRKHESFFKRLSV